MITHRTTELYKTHLLRKVEQKQDKIKSGPKNDTYYEIQGESEMDSKYYYHLASRAFKNNTVNPNMISRLRKGAKMLSVGTGPGHLERTLLRFGIPFENIDVSDITIHPRIARYPFRKHTFDMRRPWPEFQEKYDYIIFPDSINCATHIDVGFISIYDVNLAKRIISSAYNLLKEQGEIRISGTFGRQTKDLIEELELMFPKIQINYDETLNSMTIKKP